jgi:hypothetical protein
MLRKAMVVLAIVLVLGSYGFSTNALARGGGHSGGGTGDSFRGNHFRGAIGGISGGGFGDYGSRTGGLHSGLRDHESGDVWGHWGSYYGPMIPAL